MIKNMINSTKIGRYINSFIPEQKQRFGKCTPYLCSTLNGEKWATCCKLGYRCPALAITNCQVYPMRPRNCRIFPKDENDLKLVKNCGYKFKK